MTSPIYCGIIEKKKRQVMIMIWSLYANLGVEMWRTTVDELEFYDEIACGDLFEGNDAREQIMIFRIG